jgi:hypothetical protein
MWKGRTFKERYDENSSAAVIDDRCNGSVWIKSIGRLSLKPVGKRIDG